MARSSGFRAGAVIFVVIGVAMVASALANSYSPVTLTLGIGFIIFGLSTRSKKAKPRVPPGFPPSPAGEAPNRPGGSAVEPPSVSEPQGTPAPWPPYGAPAPAQTWPPPGATAATPNPTPAPHPLPSAGSTQAGEPTAAVVARVTELKTSGRTVEAIDVLREATGMELYEASQYVRRLR